jgi:hypothetical protein
MFQEKYLCHFCRIGQELKYLLINQSFKMRMKFYYLLLTTHSSLYLQKRKEKRLWRIQYHFLRTEKLLI